MNSLSSFRKPVSHKSMGIEIECGVDYHTILGGNVGIHQHYGFFYCTADGSVYVPGRLNCEFVSQPLTKEWLIKEINRLEKRVGAWDFNDTCGIHIHVSRKWLTVERAKLIHKFYCGLSNWQREALFGRASNYYCGVDPWNKTRYNAINNENKETIEFRMFASGNAQWAVYCVKMVDYLITNAKHLNLDATFAFSSIHKP